MQPVQPVQSVHLFPPLSAELIALLGQLQPADWQRPTACPGWTVKDVAAHLLGGNMGRLAARREQFSAPDSIAQELEMVYAVWDYLPRPNQPFDNFATLLAWINQHNADWVQAAQRIPAPKLIELLAVTDLQLYEHFLALPPLGLAGAAVLWAGETRSPNWFDIAREYTEKWLHQQHIREACGQPLLNGRTWLYPVLDTFLRALPHTFRDQSAPTGACISVLLCGEAGGEWSLLREERGWRLYAGTADSPAAQVRLPAGLAWRLFSKALSAAAARPDVEISGDAALGAQVLETVAIMA